MFAALRCSRSSSRLWRCTRKEADKDSCAHNLLRECSLGRLGRMGGMQNREGRKPSKMHVSVTYCCITNFPKLESETINVYYLIVSVSQESRNGLAGWSSSGSLKRMPSRCWQGLQASQGLTEGGSTSKLIPVSVDRPQVLTGCWPETSAPWHVDHSVGLLRTWQSERSEREQGQERAPKTEATVFL